MMIRAVVLLAAVITLAYSVYANAEEYAVTISNEMGGIGMYKIEYTDIKMHAPYAFAYKFYYETVLIYEGKGSFNNKVLIDDSWYYVEYLMSEWRPATHGSYLIGVRREDSKTATITGTDMVITIKLGYLPYGSYDNCYLEYGGSAYDDFIIINDSKYSVKRIDSKF